MNFVGYEPGFKGYQFWDAAHQHFEISHDVKFEETLFPAKKIEIDTVNSGAIEQPPNS